MRIFADMHAIKHTLNSKTEAHSYPLWSVDTPVAGQLPKRTGSECWAAVGKFVGNGK